MSVRFEVETPEEEINAALGRFTNLNPDMLLDPIGALVTSQTQRRIDVEKSSPDGAPWEPNREGSETLVESGALRDTIDYEVTGMAVEVGSPLIYAAVHQMGATIVSKEAKALVFTVGGKTVFAQKVTIPPRPYLGLSPVNRMEIENLVDTIIRSLVQ
ncbi:phage virion morphogenesis protein [Roseibium sp.]|uniref:phage virion morphogenesis protein n=1 Tax=Roseibium sp. TaxID=1936156 RepID=UPI003D0BB645